MAKERLLTHPQLTAANFKRYTGTTRQLTLGSKAFRPEELSSLLLRSLKTNAEAYLGEPITEAVITVPAYFNDTQRKATKIAGELAGLKVDRLLNEPTAAAITHGLHSKDEKRYLIFDLGGGTFDISIVEYFEDVLEVHACSGDNFLGDNDFTAQIYKHFVEQLRDSLKLGEILDSSLDEHGFTCRKIRRLYSMKNSEFEIGNIFSINIGNGNYGFVILCPGKLKFRHSNSFKN